jgi:site-specific DNA recombinase
VKHETEITTEANRRIALYARVSTDRQADADTVDSQITELKNRIESDGYRIDEELTYVDDGFSGSILDRPALERLRDSAAAGVFDLLYVHDPDRLARKYAYQVLLVDELQRCGVEVVFLNRAHGGSAEDHLLLQVQGMMAEYERAKILERSRRGKIHAARQGKLNVMSGAPYGFRYVSKHEGAGVARYEILEDEACIVRWMFGLIVAERASIGELRRQLIEKGILTRTGKENWDRATIQGILRNPAYKGEARYGKTRIGEKRPKNGNRKGSTENGNQPYSRYQNIDQSVAISVPAIVSEELFDAVGLQLDENRKRHRQRAAGPSFLLQGLTVCGECNYAFCGDRVTHKRQDGSVQWQQEYYRCTGGRTGRKAVGRLCYNRQVRGDNLEQVVWADVGALLKNPQRISEEYERRLDGNVDEETVRHQDSVSKQMKTVRRGISRLIDAYGDALIDKDEFEPRITRAKERLRTLEDEHSTLSDEANQRAAIEKTIGAIHDFTKEIESGVEAADWDTRRAVLQALVKKIEIGKDSVHIVYRISRLPFVPRPNRGALESCWWRHRTAGTVFNEPEFRAVFGLKNLKIIEPLIIVGFVTQHAQAVENDFLLEDFDGCWCGDEWLIRAGLKHEGRVGMVYGDFLCLMFG